MKRWLTVFGAFLMVASSGCKNIVLDPIKSEPPPGSSGSGSQAEQSSKALAMRFGDWMIPDDPHGVFNVTIEGTQDPDALVLFFSDKPQVCSEPVLFPPYDVMQCDPNGGFTQTILMIPPSLDRPGLIDLTDYRISAHETMWFPSCGGGTADTPGFRGTLEIVSSDASSLSVKLTAGPHQPGWPSLDADYTVPRCGAAPPVAPPSPAMAISGANLGAPPGGPMPDPTALYLFAGTAPLSCQDPWASNDCTQTSRVTLKLPAALQKPGIINLSDAAIDAKYADSRDPPAACTANDHIGGTLPYGTIEILSIDATQVSFKVYGSNTVPGGGTFDADGLYTATICP